MRKEPKTITRGIYTAASGMLADEAAQAAIAQNLANVNTVGYKRDITQFESFPQVLLRSSAQSAGSSIGSLGNGVMLKGVATDLSEGPLQQTSNPLDVALSGNGFLAVQTPQGIRYTRDGSLSRSPQGILVQATTGGAVLDQAGRSISIPAQAKAITITPQGNVLADGALMGTLQLTKSATANGAVKMGSNLYIIGNPVPAGPGVSVQQGFLEGSNVNTVQEMVAMIAVQRAYETGQKMIQTEDNATIKAVNNVPTVV